MCDGRLRGLPSPCGLLLGPPVVGLHPPEERTPRLLRLNAPYVILPPPRMTVLSLVMPEVPVPSSVEIPEASAAPDFHFHTSK